MNRMTLASTVCCLLVATVPAASDWPHWRGPNRNGLVDGANPPVEWSEGKNVRWKAPIPGLGHATPVVWGERIFVQTAVMTDKVVENTGGGRRRPPPNLFQYRVLALDRRTGEKIWDRTVREARPHEGMHRTASFASPSGITDGENLYAYFGSQGLYCLDMDGNLKWEKDLGKYWSRAAFGEGASPMIHGSTLVINWDHEGDSFIVALDKASGRELWRKARNEVTSWSTPLPVDHGGRTQVIVSASRRTRSYDLKTGALIWECGGLGTNVIPTPLYENGVVYVASGHRDPAMQAIDLAGAKGDVSGSDSVLWSISRNTPYVSSPLLYGGRLFLMKGRGAILSCYNAGTGKPLFGPERLDGMGFVYASLVGAGGRVYICDLEGTTLVVRNGPEFEVMAKNTLDEGSGASPVVVGDAIYLRGRSHLYCIAEDKRN